MAKKRKADKSFKEPNNTKSAKYDVEEIFNDSEDDFFVGRDKVLLDAGPGVKRRRRLAEQEKGLEPSDEEILPYQDDEDEDEDPLDSDVDDSDPEQDDHLRGTPGSEDGLEDDEESEENWGADRSDYYNADVIETEADALEEENEAKRLHQKQLKNMTEADFGYDENEWADDKKDNARGKSVTEKLPDAQIPESATRQQKLDILRSRYPEFQPLAADFVRLQQTKNDLDAAVERVRSAVQAGAQCGNGLPAAVKRDALAAYLATISLYFAVVSSTFAIDPPNQKITALPPLELHDHAVIQSLTRARHLWDQVADLDIAEPLLVPSTFPLLSLQPRVQYREVYNDDDEGAKNDLLRLKKSKKSSKTHTESLAEVKQQEAQKAQSNVTPDEKKKKKSKSKNKPIEVQDLLAQTHTEDDSVDSDSELGDENPLSAEAYAEKARKRKSLRFYTSQLASKASKRGHASRVAGGDDDLPHKERNRDRAERLIKEAEARGRGGKADEADDFDDRPGDHDVRTDPRDADDEYVDSLLNTASSKKAAKAARAEAIAQAARENGTVYEKETIGPDGKRAITYAIEKNKGLMPNRKKSVRNPRVKMREKYNEKMKKLGSVRQVYKGGEGRGGYAGELTGIKSNVVKSVKLS